MTTEKTVSPHPQPPPPPLSAVLLISFRSERRLLQQTYMTWDRVRCFLCKSSHDSNLTKSTRTVLSDFRRLRLRPSANGPPPLCTNPTYQCRIAGSKQRTLQKTPTTATNQKRSSSSPLPVWSSCRHLYPLTAGFDAEWLWVQFSAVKINSKYYWSEDRKLSSCCVYHSCNVAGSLHTHKSNVPWAFDIGLEQNKKRRCERIKSNKGHIFCF